jgi:ribosomal protein L11 methyltransferase
MGNYIHIRFESITGEEKDILIAQLSGMGYEGFEEGLNYVSAYIPEQQYDEDAISTLNKDYKKEIIAPRNWNEEWEQTFQPVVIGSFCAIRAHFHAPMNGVQHEIIITPKMSFGTGHHATTCLMIQSMQGLDLAGTHVLDFGTGTGILAILAEKLGARGITAIDNDDWSINNAAENIALNQCSAIDLHRAESLQMPDLFDIILANINKHVLLANMDVIKQHLTPGGVVLMSGLLSGDQRDIETAATKTGLEVIDRKEQENWLCLKLKNF